MLVCVPAKNAEKKSIDLNPHSEQPKTDQFNILTREYRKMVMLYTRALVYVCVFHNLIFDDVLNNGMANEPLCI